MQNKLALKALCIFFAAMALLTLIARAADSLLIANVTAQPAARSALNHEARSEGTVEAADVQMVWTLSGLRVARVCTSVGGSVKTGDVLVEFERQSVSDALGEAQAALDKLVNSRAQLDLDMPDEKEEKDASAEKKKRDDKLRELKLEAVDLDIRRAQLKVRKLEALRSDGAQVRSSMDAIVTTIGIQAGKETSTDALMQLFGTGGGLILTCKITRDEAKYVSVGDAAQVTPQGEIQPARMRVASVSQPDEKGQVAVSIALPDEGFSIGTRCSILFSHATETYPAVVPLSGLRRESSSEYVLVLRNRKSVLGDTQLVERVPVTVQDRDGKRAAVNGAILDTDLIITGWDKTVETGDRVRLVEP